MATYERLLLSSDGGVISQKQQAEQTPNTATLAIYLGGSGDDCGRIVKTQIYSRLKPDDENSSFPNYKHIAHLAVDTTDRSFSGPLGENKDDNTIGSKTMSFEPSETFNIGSADISKLISQKTALSLKHEYDWFDETIKPTVMSDSGAGGNRQVGRFLMMAKSSSFRTTVRAKIDAIREGLDNCELNIHVVSGSSGGTGSGIVWDVCNMLREVTSDIDNVKIFLYLFLPDVNLANIPQANVNVRQYVQANGYAMLQELEYCMGMPGNFGSFKQPYQGHPGIPWNKPPADIVHLIGATNGNQDAIPQAYFNAMNVVAEYILDFLTASDVKHDLRQHLSNITEAASRADSRKKFGSSVNYCVLGASCAKLPIREVNTYLASEVFDKFAYIDKLIPTEGDVFNLAADAFAKGARSYTGLYDRVLSQIWNRTTDGYDEYEARYDWRTVVEHGDATLVEHYTDQTAGKLNAVEVNASSMVTPENSDSLIGSVRSSLAAVIRDVNRGPVFAERMLSASNKNNLLNIINGMLEENKRRQNQEEAQEEQLYNKYLVAKSRFEVRMRRRRFHKYENAIRNYEHHKLWVSVYKKLEDKLLTFKQQVEDIDASFYKKLSSVTTNLIETFDANKQALASLKKLGSNEDSFAMPLMTMKELQPSLDAEVDKVNIPGMFDCMLGDMLDNPEVWITENEYMISRFVTDFILEKAFSGFADRSITRFLRDKYKNKLGYELNDQQLSDRIYDDWIVPLTKRASPLFFINTALWGPSDMDYIGYLSYPSVSAPIQTSVKKMEKTSQKLFTAKCSALTDRIYCMSVGSAVPLAAYGYCKQFEETYFSTRSKGSHYYCGKPLDGIDFTDWNKLPSIIPQSHAELENVSADLLKLYTDAKELFKNARSTGVIDDEGYICVPSQKALEKLSASLQGFEAKLTETKDVNGIPELDKAIEELKKVKDPALVRTNRQLPVDGDRSEDVILKVMEDHFVSSPAIHKEVASYVEVVHASTGKAEALLKAAEERIGSLKSAEATKQEFFNAFFAGVLTVEGNTVVYKKQLAGIVGHSIDTILSDFSMPFGAIAPYQALLSFSELNAEARENIKTIAAERLNKGSAELHEAAKSIASLMTNERISAYLDLSKAYPHKEQEIALFIAELNRRFAIHCKLYGLSESAA